MRRLIEHQVAVRAFGALNLFFDTCPRCNSIGGFLIIHLLQKNVVNILLVRKFVVSLHC